MIIKSDTRPSELVRKEREHLIAIGLLVPKDVTAREIKPRHVDGPTPQAWQDVPTLRMDAEAIRVVKKFLAPPSIFEPLPWEPRVKMHQLKRN